MTEGDRLSRGKEFFDAIRAGDTATVKALLDAEPALATAKNEQGQSAILAAIYNQKTEIRGLLLARGIPLEFHEAAGAGHLDCVKQFVEKDPSLVSSYSPDGFPILGLAAVFGHRPVAEYLLEKGADVNAVSKNGTGYTALTGAVASSNADLVAFLLAHGADAGHRYGPGYSPLVEAAANGKLEIVRMLLDHGADPHAKTNDGKTALRFAEERGHKSVAELLRRRGAGGRAATAADTER
jgi:ankyrin repeat protein